MENQVINEAMEAAIEENSKFDLKTAGAFGAGLATGIITQVVTGLIVKAIRKKKANKMIELPQEEAAENQEANEEK